MRIKNQRGVSEVRFYKKLDSFTFETSKNHLIRNFLLNERVRVNESWLIVRLNHLRRNQRYNSQKLFLKQWKLYLIYNILKSFFAYRNFVLHIFKAHSLILSLKGVFIFFQIWVIFVCTVHWRLMKICVKIITMKVHLTINSIFGAELSFIRKKLNYTG